MGKVPGSGRQKGTPNKASADLRAAAAAYTLEALDTLARLMREGDNRTSFMAAREILDRGCGKLAITGDIVLGTSSPLLEAMEKLGNRGLPGDGARVINAQ